MLRRILLTLFASVGLMCLAVGQQGYNQRRSILQVTDVTTDRTEPSVNFEKNRTKLLGAVVYIDLFDSCVKMQLTDGNGKLIEEPFILNYEPSTYWYYLKYKHTLLNGETTIYEYTLKPSISNGKIIYATLTVHINGWEEVCLTLRPFYNQ